MRKEAPTSPAKTFQTRRSCLCYLVKNQLCFFMGSFIYIPAMICALEKHIKCNFPWYLNFHLIDHYTSGHWRGFLFLLNSIGCSCQSRFNFCYITATLYLEWFHHNYLLFLRQNIGFILIAELSYFNFSKVACLNNLSLRIKISS